MRTLIGPPTSGFREAVGSDMLTMVFAGLLNILKTTCAGVPTASSQPEIDPAPTL